MMPVKCQFREEPLPSDLRGVEEIVVSSGFFSRAEVGVARELLGERLNRGPSSGYFFIFAEDGGQVLGYTCFGPVPCTLGTYDLYWIAVRSPLRGAGLGKTLLDRTERRILRMGGERIFVETSSRDLYLPSRRFYRACGYEEAAVLKEFYGPGDDKVIYIKKLNPDPVGSDKGGQVCS